jgi:hypothetical protein
MHRVRPRRPCPRRALTTGRQRSSTDNHGRYLGPPSWRISPSGAARGSFPSSRWAALGPRPGRERPERLGQPRATVGIMCPAQQPPRPSAAGHSQQPIRSDTEGVTGSNPVAPTRYRRWSGRVFGPGFVIPEAVRRSRGSTWAATPLSREPQDANPVDSREQVKDDLWDNIAIYARAGKPSNLAGSQQVSR